MCQDIRTRLGESSDNSNLVKGPMNSLAGFLRKRWKWIVLPIAMLFVVVLSLPTLVGVKWFYQPMLDRLSADNFHVTVDSVEVGWFRPIAFRNIKLYQSEADAKVSNSVEQIKLLSIRSIESNRSLLGFILGGRNLGTIQIVDPVVNVELLENGSNLERLVHAIEGKPSAGASTFKSTSSPKLDADIQIRGFAVNVTEDKSDEKIFIVPPFDANFSYRSLNQDSTVKVQPAKILDHVTITPELIRLGLSKAVPLLAKSAWFDGKVSLETDEINIPVQHPEDSRGKAVLTLHEVRSGPAEPTMITAIDIVRQLFRQDIPNELVFVDGSTIDVEIADKRVFHRGVRAGLPRLDERLQIATSGSVGIKDRTLDVALELPVPIEQLAQRDSVKSLGVPSITLPIRGTLDSPELDWTAMRHDSSGLLNVISSVLKDDSPAMSGVVGALGQVADGKADEAIGAGLQLVKDLWQLRQDRQKARMQADQKEAEKDKDKDEPPKRSRPFRDALKNLLRGDN